MARQLRAFAAVLLCLGAAAACRKAPEPPANRPRHRLLDQLPEPPLNRPVTAQPQQEASQQAGRRDVEVTRSGQLVRGRLEAAGRVTVFGDSIRIDDPGGPVLVFVRLPRSLPGLRPDSGAGSARITERGGPEGAERSVVVRIGTNLVFAETWDSDVRPLQLDLGYLLLVQRPDIAGDGLPDIPVVAVSRGRDIARLAPGTLDTLPSPAGPLATLVQVSSRSDSVYILRAWVVRAR